MMHDWGYGWGWGGGMIFGPLFMIGGPVLLIILIVVVVRWLGSSSDTPGVRLAPSPREILDERFAKGERGILASPAAGRHSSPTFCGVLNAPCAPC
jgi:putative membrane protein